VYLFKSEEKTTGQGFMQSKKKILIVDQEITYRDLLKEVLRDKYIVLDSGDFNEGLDLAKFNVPDLIIIDSEMPGRKGVDLCAALKQHPETRDVPVLLVTSLANIEDIILGLQAGASDYITKPMCLQEVVARIESHLQTQDDYAELEHKDLLMLLELSGTISVTKNPTEILRLIVNKITKIIDVTRCSVISFTDGKKLVVKASSDFDNKQEITLNLNRYPEIRKAL
jgi:DNA-binding response OmpR family regulator